ncbi:MAG: glycoside hydrolase family 15 protein [Pyrinomonadaceae bacterium]
MRDIPVGNGSLLVNFDDKYQIRDIYFPHVGQENHTEGFPFRFGAWAEGLFSWVFTDDWKRNLRYVPGALVTNVTLTNEKLGLQIRCNDAVHGTDNIYLRRIVVRDLASYDREVRLFLHHDFRLYENKVGDTAYFDPDTFSLIHYKKHRYFLINTVPPFNSFATGRKAFRESEGTWRDAEDGELHGGAITEGSVDSTIAVNLTIGAGAEQQIFYWIAAGTTHLEVAALNEKIIDHGPEEYIAQAGAADRSWVSTAVIADSALPLEVLELYERSLLIVRSQVDRGGAIIAATDHDVTERATDHYSYLWPRDGAFVANALDTAGYPEFSVKFLELCQRIVHRRGYFLQKYNPDGSLGSGWHAWWDNKRKVRLDPIQEDETALVIWSAWEHYRRAATLPETEQYSELIVRCADFLAEFRDPATGLPMPSWNLWEDRFGIHAFTCATVVAGLRAAAEFAVRFEDPARAERYAAGADEVTAAMDEHLYSVELGRFLRGLLVDADDTMQADTTIDASLFGVFYFGCFPPHDERVKSTMAAVEAKLRTVSSLGGIARFEDDNYMRSGIDAPPNPWIITTLWLAEYYIAIARTRSDLEKALPFLEWTTQRALTSGVLAEQIDPFSGAPRSVSPLTWSHSTFIAAVCSYLAKWRELQGARFISNTQ